MQAIGEDQLKPPDSDPSTLLKDGEQLMDVQMVDDCYSNIKITFHAKLVHVHVYCNGITDILHSD